MSSRILAMVVVATVVACAGESTDDPTARDLSLAPAESVAVLNDQPAVEPPTDAEPPRTASQPETARRPEPPAAPRTTTLTLAEGTVLMLSAGDTITSRHNDQGEPVVAINSEAILDAAGRVVIPTASVFTGVISDIAPAESPGGEGRLVLTFNRVEFGGNVFEVVARTDSIGAFMKGRGVTAGNVATVAGGAAVGAVAGRVIGGNRTGTVVGAVAGAAAGAGIASATRDIDIILPEGAPIRLVLTAPFALVLEN